MRCFTEGWDCTVKNDKLSLGSYIYTSLTDHVEGEAINNAQSKAMRHIEILSYHIWSKSIHEAWEDNPTITTFQTLANPRIEGKSQQGVSNSGVLWSDLAILPRISTTVSWVTPERIRFPYWPNEAIGGRFGDFLQILDLATKQWIKERGSYPATTNC